MSKNIRDILTHAKLVLFDLDGTLLCQQPTLHQTLLAFLEELGYSLAHEAQAAGARWADQYWAQADSDERMQEFRQDESAFWPVYVRQYLSAMDLPEDIPDAIIEKIIRGLTESFKPEVKLAEYSKDLLWRLRARQVMTGLVSNRHHPLTGLAIDLGLIDLFDFTLSAGQVGRRKPDGLIFEQALAMAGHVNPDEAVYIGDNYYTDVVGAHSVGLSAILIDQHNAYGHFLEDCLIVHQLREVVKFIPE
jgi:putative hydrolase of the HAD superfamily